MQGRLLPCEKRLGSRYVRAGISARSQLAWPRGAGDMQGASAGCGVDVVDDGQRAWSYM